MRVRMVSGLRPVRATWIVTALCIVSVLILIVSVIACAGPTPPNPTPAPSPKSGLVKATWVKPEVVGSTVSIEVSEVEKNIMSHFAVGISAGDIAFMAYELNGEIYVRASICPPCRSENFSLKKNTLVCDTCGTVFDAKTGDGIQGACVAFPKAAVTYEISNGKMVMKGDDLITAYQNTLEPG